MTTDDPQLPATTSAPLVPAEPEIPEEWGISTPEKRAAVTHAQRARSVKHGLLSSVPMICREAACPYKDHCVPYKMKQTTKGERCIKEIGQIMEALESYLSEFGIEPTDPGQRVDRIQVQQLITLEVLIDRAQMLLASGDLVETIDVAFSPDGQDILQQPQLHKAAEALPKLQRRHNEILQLLMATRKNKVEMQQTTGETIDKMMTRMLLNAQAVKARLEMMKQGNLEEADRMGLEYGLKANPVALPQETIEQDPEE